MTYETILFEPGTVAKITLFIEQAVRENPEEYFWVHKRWPNALYKSKGES